MGTRGPRGLSAAWLVVLAAWGAHAEETPVAAGPPRGFPAWCVRRFDPWHARLSTNFVAAVARFDRLFGDDRMVEEADDSHLDLAVGVRVSRFDGAAFAHRTRASLALPRLQRRVLLVLDQRTETESPDSAKEIAAAYENTTPDLGLRLNLFEPRRARLTAGAGLRVGSETQAYGKLRGSMALGFGERTELYLSQTLQYYSVDQWRTTPNLRLSRAVGLRWIVQTNPRVTWRELEPGYEPELTFSAFRMVGRLQAFRLDLGGNWPNTPHSRETRYFVQGAQRWRLGRPWLFGELTVGLGFPQTEGYAPDPYVRGIVEVILGNG